jgi:hypothetical protein
MTYKYRVVECPINDSADYDYIWESAIHNTLGPFWKFADTAKGNVHFEKRFDDGPDAYGGAVLIIDAVFDEQTDLAYFKLNFDLPYDSIVISSDMETTFIKKG